LKIGGLSSIGVRQGAGFWLHCANVDALTAAALLMAPREDLFEVHEISTTVNRVANDRPALLEPTAQSPTLARFTPTTPAIAEAQISAPAKRVKKTRKMSGKHRCFDCGLIDASCRRVLRHLPASNRLGNCVRYSRLQAGFA
jgi:hypothetical protein